MQRGTVVRRAQALLPCDEEDGVEDDHGVKSKAKAPISSKMQIWLRTGNIGALLLNLICIILFLNSGVLSNAVGGQQTSVRRREAQDIKTTPVRVVAEAAPTVIDAAPADSEIAPADSDIAADVEEAEDLEKVAVTTPTTPAHHHTHTHHAIPVRHTVPVRHAATAPHDISVQDAAAVTSAVTTTTPVKVHSSIPVRHAATVHREAVAATTTTDLSTFTIASTSTPVEPLACRDFLHQVKAHTYPVKVQDPNIQRDTYILKTKTAHPFRMSFHHEVFDRPRWEIYKKGFYYEHTLEQIWTDILEKAEPGARVLDVGASTGYFSLVSGSVGAFQVDAFEPNLKNNLRFCESVIMNGWEHGYEVAGPVKKATVHVWPVGLSDITGTRKFYEWNGNPGAGHFDHPGHTRTDGHMLPVTTLDAFAEQRGWFNEGARQNIQILKIDVEHHETNVLAGAAKLLQSGMIQNVFLDLFLDAAADRNSKLQALELLVNSGYKLIAQGGYVGPDKPSIWKNDETLPKRMMDHLETENIRNWNLWWSL